MQLTETPFTEPLANILAKPPGQAIRLFWLGQAGFVIEGNRRRVVIDPYLSDSLAEKYRGSEFPHRRMMPAPVSAAQLTYVDLVLATHAHSDHLDPGTLPELMAANPRAKLVAPRAAASLALERSGVSTARLIAVDAGQTVSPMPGVEIICTRAAHETLARDEAGHYKFLGLALRFGSVCLYHSGDTVPFEGQLEEVASLKADVALLPVNGRDAKRAAKGVPGNLQLAEAVALARSAGIRALIAHHFDLFAFNTIPRADIEATAAKETSVQVKAASLGVCYRIA